MARSKKKADKEISPEIGELIKNIAVARKAILEDAGRDRSASGKINPCPVCGEGILRYSIASNKHVWAACTSKTCVRWLE